MFFLKISKMEIPMNNKKAEKMNQKFWDEIAPVHEKSYNIAKLKNKDSLIDKFQKNDFYPVKDKKILYLQCHIGTDSISLALDGAKVTAVDFSEKSIEIANKLNREIGTDVEFISSNIFDLKNKLSGKFDIVYTSKGVLAWVSDIKKWSEIISYYLKIGGIFYIMEIHPVKFIFDDTVKNDLKVKYSYFHNNQPMLWEDEYPDYSDKTYIPKSGSYEWTWSLSDIINALIENGLKIEKFNEYDKLFYDGHPGMIKGSDGLWYLEKYKGMIPYTFTIIARKI
jgi:2-polyprenyl-3-methyl-5-hydroxy-6-metoxy-1,4-benzoquinol methylase